MDHPKSVKLPSSARPPEMPPHLRVPPPQIGEVELMNRLARVRQTLVAGWPRREIVRMCQGEFLVSPRTAYRYIRKVQQQMARQKEREPLAYGRQLAQDRRDILFDCITRTMQALNPRDPRHLPHLTSLASVAARIVDQQESSADKRARDALAGRGPAIQVTAQRSSEQNARALFRDERPCQSPLLTYIFLSTADSRSQIMCRVLTVLVGTGAWHHFL